MKPSSGATVLEQTSELKRPKASIGERTYTAGGLFCGIGGFCLGFRSAGFRNLWSVDNDPDVERVYRANMPDTPFIRADVRELHAWDLEPVDVIHAGFPCQSFSQAGGRKGFDDERGKLFFELIRIVREFGKERPRAVVLENSPFLKYGQGGAWFLTVQAELRKAGYWFRDANAAELNAYELTDLPQQRVRLFMVALSVDHFSTGRFEFPATDGEAVKPKALERYIDFNGIAPRDYYLARENRYHKMISASAQERTAIYQLRKYEVRVKDPGVCPTLTANMGSGGHNVPFVFDQGGLRKLTEYECLRLQGFPESFQFSEDVPRHRRYVQVGNAVPVPVAKLVAQQLKRRLDEESC